MWHKFPINFGFDGCQPHSSGKIEFIIPVLPSKLCYLIHRSCSGVCFYVILWIMENWNVDNTSYNYMATVYRFPEWYLHQNTHRLSPHIWCVINIHIMPSSLCVKKMAFCVCLFCNEYNGLCLQMGNSICRGMLNWNGIVFVVEWLWKTEKW